MTTETPENESGSDAFHLKYRPQRLDRVIGHEVAVTRLKGMVSSGKVPNALMFVGPPSVGKTTLARALAFELNGKPALKQQDYTELNGNAERSIEEMRNLISVSKFRPANKKRIIVIDEAQGILGNQPAAAALLKPLEEPSRDTIWILCSMDPTKFQSSINGKAILSRCTQFVLEPHTNLDLLKQAMRITKRENMDYLDKEVLKEVVRNSGSAMRTVANLLQALRDYYDGLEDKPESMDSSMISTVMKSLESADDKRVPEILAAIFCGQYAVAQKGILYLQDPFQAINKLLWASSFFVNHLVLNGERHSKVWYTPLNKDFLAKIKAAGAKPTLGQAAAVQAAFVEMKYKAQMFAVGEAELLSSTIYRIIKDIHAK